MATERRRRGPLDPRVLDLAPALPRHLRASVAAAVIVAVAVLVQAEVLARGLPRLVDGDAAAVGPLVATLVAAAAVRATVAAVVERSAAGALRSTRAEVRHRVLDRLAALRLDRRGDLDPARVQGLTGDVPAALEPWVRAYVPAVALAAVVPLAAGLRIATADLASAAILVVVVPLVPLFMVLVGRLTEDRTARRWHALQRLSGRFLDTLEGLPTLRLFGRADAQVARVRAVTERYRAVTMGTLRIAFLSALVLELLATLSVALIAVSLGIRLTHGGLDLTTALVVLLLAPECLLPLRRVGAAYHAAAAGADAAADVETALALPERPAGSGPLPRGAVLVLDEVAVVDERRGPRLAPTDLAVAPGEVVAVTGPSGGGKSTLLDVARGALAPTDGCAHLDGIDLARIEPGVRARSLRWVPQRPRPIGATVADSAAAGHPDVPGRDAAVAAALDALGLVALAERSPDALSGGELRRLGLARALVGVELGTVDHLLVDEPTAQLDEVSAARVVAALLGATEHGAGVLVATHDPRLIERADRVVALGAAPTRDRARAVAASPPTRAPAVPPPAPATTVEALDRLAATGRSGRGGDIRWVVALARGQRARLAGAHALGVAAEACTVALAGTAAWLVVRAAERPSFAALAVAAVAVRAFGLGKGVLRYGERLASHDVTFRLLAEVRASVVGRLAHLSPGGLPRRGQGDLLRCVVADVDRLQDLPLRVVGPAVSALVVAAGATVAAALIDPVAGLVLGGAVAVVGVALPVAVHRRARGDERTGAAARAAAATATVALATDVEELVACGAEPAWRAEVERAEADVDRIEARRAVVDRRASAVAAAAPALAVAGVVAAVGPASAGLAGPALAVVVLLPLAVMELVGPLAGLGPVLAGVEAAAARVRAVVDAPDPVAEPDAPEAPPRRGDLALDRVAFGWPGEAPVVADVVLRVDEGDRVLVAGPSGSGKSTLAATLVRFLPLASGSVEVGGRPAEALGGEAVRRVVTWCPQDPWFADSTLADNLRIARPGATDEELWAVLDTVHLGAWARRLPDGLATRLARDAATASGGERQRLALARALLGDRRAVVLDEPTSHLDEPTAEAVLRDLLAATADRAVIVLGHDRDELGWSGRVHDLAAATPAPSPDPVAPASLSAVGP